jgi:hypothetical protein
MNDKPTLSISDAKAKEVASARERMEALERELAELKQLEELAAKHKIKLSPDAPTVMPWDVKSIGELIESYIGSPSYLALSHASRKHYEIILGSVRADHGAEQLVNLNAESFGAWHSKWSEGGKKSMGYTKIKMVRLIVGFGTEVLNNSECARLFGILSKLKFEGPKARVERLTLAQANDIRAMARRLGRPSIALAQAFQSDVGLLQKDTIGEWVPFEEIGMSEYTAKSTKWLRGIRWSEIDDNLIFRHQGGAWQDDIEFDLRKAPSVLEELRIKFGFHLDKSSRDDLPRSGAIIINEYDEQPWEAIEFRRWWRKVADACGISKKVRNSDSRSRGNDDVQEASDGEAEGRLAL